MRNKSQVVLPLDLGICIPEGDFVFKVADICEGLDYTELWETYVRAWRKVNPITMFEILVFGYIPYHELLSQNTEHLIFLSSYRVYADLQHPITETAPQLIDVIKDDPVFHETEDYALAKSRAERFLNNNPYPKNWTIVRPVISFSDRRLDINMISGHTVIDAANAGVPLQLPLEAKNLIAGLDWAGNSGKLIANLLLKDNCKGEAYTISSAQNITWGDVADIYTKLLNVQFEWVPANYPHNVWNWYYDRAYDREIDNSKVLKATGLKPEDFKSIEEGIRTELKKLGAIK